MPSVTELPSMTAVTSDAELESSVGEHGSDAHAWTVNGFGLKGNTQPVGGRDASAYCPGVFDGAGVGVGAGVDFGVGVVVGAAVGLAVGSFDAAA